MEKSMEALRTEAENYASSAKELRDALRRIDEALAEICEKTGVEFVDRQPFAEGVDLHLSALKSKKMFAPGERAAERWGLHASCAAEPRLMTFHCSEWSIEWVVAAVERLPEFLRLYAEELRKRGDFLRQYAGAVESAAEALEKSLKK